MSVPLMCFLAGDNESGIVSRVVYMVFFLAVFANFPAGNVVNVLGLRMWRPEDMVRTEMGTLIKGIALLAVALYTIANRVIERFSTNERAFRDARPVREVR